MELQAFQMGQDVQNQVMQLGYEHLSNRRDLATCGDGVYDSGTESCDDGNTDSGDGCDSACNIETGCKCLTGTFCEDKFCGDGIICGNNSRKYSDGEIFCDDGNHFDGDGCSSTCKLETGYICYSTDLDPTYKCYELCGDGIRFDNNTDPNNCDDGNSLNGDGCNSLCKVEYGYTCTGGSMTSKDVCTANCGNGSRQSEEGCDDYNTQNYDGCSSTCQVEPGYSCSGGNSTHKDVCIDFCGDGLFFGDMDTSIYCDDGNTESGDGCDTNCKIEDGWKCSGGSETSPTTCVKKCLVTNCELCFENNNQKCQVCHPDFPIKGDFTCKVVTPLSQTEEMGEASQLVTGASTSAAIGVSLINFSSPMAIWLLANQFQLFMLLLLTNAALPDDVILYIKGNGLFNFNMDFIPIKENAIYQRIYNILHQDQKDEELIHMGLDSQSSFSNNMPLFLMVAVIMIIYYAVKYLIEEIRKRVQKKPRFRMLDLESEKIKLPQPPLIRIFLEAFQFLLVCVISEIFFINFSTLKSSFSYLIAFVFLICTIVFTCLSIYPISKEIENPDDDESLLKEFYSGLRPVRKARAYNPLLLIRRYFFVIWLLALQGQNPVFITTGMLIFQAGYLVNLILTRPMEDPVNNLVECLNEVIYLILIGLLTGLNTDSKWTSTNKAVFIWIMLSNSIIVSLILIGSLVLKLKEKCKPKSLIPKRVRPDPELNINLDRRNTRFNSSDISTTSIIINPLKRLKKQPSFISSPTPTVSSPQKTTTTIMEEEKIPDPHRKYQEGFDIELTSAIQANTDFPTDTNFQPKKDSTEEAKGSGAGSSEDLKADTDQKEEDLEKDEEKEEKKEEDDEIQITKVEPEFKWR